jgi:hypothetical protein
MCPSSYWDSVNNQRKFINWAIKELNIKDKSDWYDVNLHEIGGGGLLNKFKDNMPLLLDNFFPDYEWLPWKFRPCPKKYWSDVNNQKRFMDWAGKQLNVKEVSDWNKVSKKVGSFSRENSNKRIFMNLEAKNFFLNIVVLFSFYYPLFILNLNCRHGCKTSVLRDIGMT